MNIVANLLIYMMLFALGLSSAHAEQKLEMKSYYNAQYGLKFLYPTSWEFQIIPEPRKSCEYEIRLRPPSWLATLATFEYRRYSDFPLQILLCQKDFDSFIKNLMYKRRNGEWVSISKGIDMETEGIKGKGWYGIVGEVPFKSTMKTGEEGPISFLQQALLSIDRNKTALIIMEYTGSPWDIWDVDSLLKDLEIIPNGKEMVYRTSYDCKKAKSDIEKTICWNQDLAAADLEMNTIYKERMDQLSKEKRIELREKQEDWLKTLNAQCQPEQLFECIKERYSKRITALKEWK